MKFNKEKSVFYLSIFYITFTFILDLIGYFKLPDKIATQFSLSGEATKHTSTPIYLIISFAIITLLSIFCMKKDSSQKLKYILVTTLVVIANAVTIIVQL